MAEIIILAERRKGDARFSLNHGVGKVDTFLCAVCNHVLTTLAAHEDSMHSQALGRWLLGDLHPPK